MWKGKFWPHSSKTAFNRFWWNLNPKSTSWRLATKQNFISIWRCGWSQRIPSLTEKTISRVHVSPGSAETLVRRGGITNHRSIAYSLSNFSVKNYQNRSICVEVIMCNTSVVFFSIPWDSVDWIVCYLLTKCIISTRLPLYLNTIACRGL